MDYEGLMTCEAVPEAASMIETFRAIGYSLETAIADIVDNSITAGAKNIIIKRIWNGGKSVITIKDDGHGMTNDELVHAMRPGAQNPLDKRDEKDLGRFGLGLKTASFSQCRKLSVISKKNGSVNYWSWDLDYVSQCQKWNLINWIPNEFLTSLDDVSSGTLVIWSSLDRIIPSCIKADDMVYKEKFSGMLEKVRNHLSMTFHRFIEDKTINIIWGSHPILPWNPFCTSEEKLQIFPDDILPGNIKMKGFVLPHKLNFSTSTAYELAEGPLGWNAQQGFYVYRGKRLLLAGSWLGLFRKEEHYKLARILIDLPNSQDEQWQIDIKKSKAYPPANCKDQIEQYAKSIRAKAEEVFRHRGKILRQRVGQQFHPLWLDKQKDGTWTYVINRDNPLITEVKRIAKVNSNQAIDLLLKLIESNVPTKTIFIHESKDEGSHDKETTTDIETIKFTMTAMYNSFLVQGISSEKAKDKIKSIEPFNYYEDLIDNL